MERGSLHVRNREYIKSVARRLHFKKVFGSQFLRENMREKNKIIVVDRLFINKFWSSSEEGGGEKRKSFRHSAW